MLVMLELTADNDSVLRAWVMGGHLINAFLLLAALTLTAWWSGHDQPLKPGRHPVVAVVVSVALLGMLLLGASGGITALGDTLFPANSLAEGLAMDRSATAHILIKLRVIHPILALAMGAWLAFTVVVCGFSCRKRTVTVLGAALVFTVLLQIGAGFLNLFLMAPVWLQLVHLFLADVVWMLVVVLAAESLCESGLR
jgi:heme A synthase